MLKEERAILDEAIEKFAKYKNITVDEVKCVLNTGANWNARENKKIKEIEVGQKHKGICPLTILTDHGIEYGTIFIGNFFPILFKTGDLSKVILREIRSRPTVKPPILTQKVLSQILDNTIKFSNIKSDYLKLTRCILLSGPPGNGKTSISRYVKQLFQNRNKKTWHASSILDFRRMRNGHSNPFYLEDGGLIIIDDVDVDLFNRKKQGAAACELLSQLDGIEKATKPRVVIFSTNEKVENIDPAFLRPGRIDLHITIDNPDDSLRRTFIESWEPSTLGYLNVDEVVAKTDGWSFAEIEEIQQQTGMQLLFGRKPKIDWNIQKVMSKKKVGL
jgi:cell division protease FtsH